MKIKEFEIGERELVIVLIIVFMALGVKFDIDILELLFFWKK